MTWLTAVSFFLIVIEAYADYCGDNIFCNAPYKCCDLKKGCCYDSMHHTSKHFRLQIWNMWYFWFLIIFMMMSCFGGCGYYRRRRLAMLTRSSSPQPARPATTVLSPPEQRSRCRNLEGNVRHSHGRNGRHLNFFAYNGPGFSQPEPVSNLPPAYAEVISQPSLYPVNKMELPPYPGNDKPEYSPFPFSQHESTILPHHETSLPPPYSEHQFDSPQPLPVHQQFDSYHPSLLQQSIPVPTSPSHLSTQPDLSQVTREDSSITVPAERLNDSAANNRSNL